MTKRTSGKKPRSTGSAEALARAQARRAALVTSGVRDPRSLFLIPTDLVSTCKVTFPAHAFGKPGDWQPGLTLDASELCYLMASKKRSRTLGIIGRTICFLDIDDVLCLNAPYGGYDAAAVLAAERPTKRSAAVAPSADIWGSLFDAAACEHLRRINDEFRPVYVLTTSWSQALGEQRLCESLARGGLRWVVESLHPDAATPKIKGRTNRWAEIQVWLGAHPEFADRWVALDDELSGTGLDLEMHGENGPFIVLCKEAVGLREAEYLRLRTAFMRRRDGNSGFNSDEAPSSL